MTAQVTGNNEVEIGFNDADLDTVVEYFVQRSRTPGGPYELIATVADTSPGIAGGPKAKAIASGTCMARAALAF